MGGSPWDLPGTGNPRQCFSRRELQNGCLGPLADAECAAGNMRQSIVRGGPCAPHRSRWRQVVYRIPHKPFQDVLPLRGITKVPRGSSKGPEFVSIWKFHTLVQTSSSGKEFVILDRLVPSALLEHDRNCD